MTRKIFGTDGIRGTANVAPMTADMALKVAMAAASVLTRGNGAQTNRVIIGKDTRLSGYMFEEAMAAGFVAMGMETLMVGPIPTPGIALLTRSMRADLGVMISASHNPFHDNGIKLFASDGYKLPDATEQAIETLLDDPGLLALPKPELIGRAKRLEDATGRYVEFIKSSFPKGQSLKGLKVVVDCAHGAAYKVAPQVLWELEATVVPLSVQPNGRNINNNCGATKPELLQKMVLEAKADIGIALDGDADRLLLVDEKGAVIDGDQILATLAIDWQTTGRLNKQAVVATVMSNLGLERFLNSRQIDLVRTAVGDRYVVERMREDAINLGGEQSGHIVMTDFGTTGDGLLTALQALAILVQQGKSASTVFSAYAPVPQLLQNIRFEGGEPLKLPPVQQAIEGAMAVLGTQGRLLVRASGTEPVIRVMAESDDAKLVETVVRNLCNDIERLSKSGT